ncbi:hypothetical protein HPS57_11725 [Prevotella sp. PINT]|uniref:hypothetical protein n=1 Tax=Palleniella intestinalis TaxID=2736291 RepID=UPI001557A255|nr:hypothetical protein [Palleniella intestinalis]NPD82634.1 hypothetical protein [Palleniella intestinalis]
MKTIHHHVKERIRHTVAAEGDVLHLCHTPHDKRRISAPLDPCSRRDNKDFIDDRTQLWLS